jgi:hypothetical protein
MSAPGGGDVLATLRGAARSVRRRARLAVALMSKTRISALLYRGTLAGAASGLPLTLLYVGDQAGAPEAEVYFKPAAGEKESPRNPPEVLFRGSLLEYAMHRADLEKEAAAADVVVHEVFPGAPAHDTDVLHYAMLEGSLRVAPTIEQQIRRVRSRQQRRLLREALRADAYEARVATGPEAFETFRTTMYEPYVRERFGAWGHIDAPEGLRAFYDRFGSVLLLAPRGDPREPVAGAILLDERYARGALGYHRNGFVDGCAWAPSLLAERTAALELALMKHAIANGFERIDLGYARAVLNDGLVVHKRRLGCAFNVAPYSPLHRVRVQPGLRVAVFARYPLVVGGPDAFSAVLGYDGSAPQLTKRRWRAVLKGYALSISGSVASPPAGLRSAVVWMGSSGAGEAAFRAAVAETLDLPDGVEFRADAER